MSHESCLDYPRGDGEALTVGNAGVVLSSVNTLFWRPSRWTGAKAIRLVAISESLNAPAESKTHACVDMLHTGIGIPREDGLE